ncbi:MAG: HD domain-containing protein [Methanosarcinales archaeon]|nr:MAG: HD domain-containing protein [Methanosarcinales archaeon]
MKVIRDPIHGYIVLDDLALALIDTPEMQRLRRIRQLGLSNFVYPGANHTRFEHSLGTLHLTDQLLHQLQVTGPERDEVRAAALLHDIGHGPFSHATEELIRQRTGKGHDDVEGRISNGAIANVLKAHSLDSVRIAQLIQGETAYGQLINSEIDVDKMDYLVRDAHYTGVAYGTIDYVRLIHEMELCEEQLVIREGGIQAAESLLVSRFLMHPTVYYHHVSRIAEAMFAHAIEELIRSGLDPVELSGMDDYELMMLLRSSKGYSKEICERMDNRRLFKRALYVGKDSVNVERMLKLRDEARKVESEIAKESGVPEGHVLLDIPKRPEMIEMKARVMVNGEMKRLDEISHLVRILVDAQWDNWKLGVYAPEEYKEKVGEAASIILSVRKPPVQHKLSGD